MARLDHFIGSFANDAAATAYLVGNSFAQSVALVYSNTTDGDMRFWDGAAWIHVVSNQHSLLTGLSADDHTQYLLLAGRAGGQVAHGGTANTDNLELRPNTTTPPTSLALNQNIIFSRGRIAFTGFTDLTTGSGVPSPNYSLLRHDETCDCTGQGSVIPQGFWYSPTFSYNTAQAFGGSATFQDGSIWQESAAIAGAHTTFSLGSFEAGVRYQVQHVGAGKPPSELYGLSAQPAADAGSGSLTVSEMTGVETNAVFNLKAFLSLESLRNGVVCTTYRHFAACSDIAHGLLLEGGSTIGTEIGFDIRNLNHGSTCITLRSDNASAYMEHAGPIRIKHDANQLLFGTGQDVAIGRGAANRLDLATGDSFRIVGGELQFGGDLALSRGAANQLDLAANDSFKLNGTGLIDFAVSDALGGGAAATLGTIGGTGPTAAGQNLWLKIKIAGTDYWLPAWV